MGVVRGRMDVISVCNFVVRDAGQPEVHEIRVDIFVVDALW